MFRDVYARSTAPAPTVPPTLSPTLAPTNAPANARAERDVVWLEPLDRVRANEEGHRLNVELGFDE